MKLQCKGPCKRTLIPTNQNWLRKNGKWGAVCRQCHNHQRVQWARYQRSLLRPANRKWDWGDSYIKVIKHGLAKSGNTAPVEMDSETLHALMDCQNGRCAILGKTFNIPTGTWVFDGAGLTAWLNSLTEVERMMTPLLVRITNKDGWVPGNLAWIAKAFESLYIGCGSDLAQLRVVLTEAMSKNMHVVMREAIYERRKIRLELGRKPKQEKDEE